MITVFTPCYNRAYTLGRLFDSLQAQTYRDFEWIVVDDGSADGTRELCDRLGKLASFPMRYLWQENAGKHAAINVGAAVAQGDWFFIVDSDDWLPSDSLEVNARYLAQVEADPQFAGVSGVRARADGSWLIAPYSGLGDVPKPIRDRFNLEYLDATPQEYRDDYGMPGDRAEIVRANLVRSSPFPVFPGERFVSEYYLWQTLSNEGFKIRWFNAPTYYGDYLDDGLTRNMRDVMRKNPLGRSFVDNFTLDSKVPLRSKLRSAVNYSRYGRFGGKTVGELACEAKSKPLFALGLLPALVMPIRDERVDG